MSEQSILDQIIANNQSEEIVNLDAVEIVGSLLEELNERERDILSRRFGLRGQNGETLETGNHRQMPWVDSRKNQAN